TTLWFLRSFETRRVLDAALAGLGAAAAMYGKYWSVFLLLGLGIAALADRRRAAYFRSPAPWVTIAVGALALAPHAAWLIANDFAPFSYAIVLHGTGSLASTIGDAFAYLARSVACVAVRLVMVAVVARPSRAAVRDMAWPSSPARRLAATAFWAVPLLPALIAPFAGLRLVSLWSMSAFALLPVMLLSSPLVAITRRDAVGVLALAVAFPIVMVAVAPAIAFAIHSAGPAPATAHGSLLARPIEQLWRETTDGPLRIFSGFDELTDGVSFYMPSHPLAVRVLDGIPSAAIEERIDRDGIALLCPMRSSVAAADWCAKAAIARAPAPPVPHGKRIWGAGPPAVPSASKATPRVISSSPSRPASRKHRRPRGSRSPPASSGISWRGSDGGLDQRDGVLKRRLPACHGALEFGAGAVEPLELVPFLPLVEEGVDQRVAGDRLQHAVAEAIFARGADIFVGEVDAGYA